MLAEWQIPEDWCRSAIVKIPKKGNISRCTNCGSITHLFVPGKAFCVVLLRRLRSAHRAVRRIRHPLAINFVDFKKAFDSIHRQSPWQILHLYWRPLTPSSRMVPMIEPLHQDREWPHRMPLGLGKDASCPLSFSSSPSTTSYSELEHALGPAFTGPNLIVSATWISQMTSP